MTPDIIISVRFFAPSEGGRETPIQGCFYSCPLFVGDEGFDCRLMLDGNRLELGAIYEVPVKFLCKDKALPKMKPGEEVYLWEGRNIAKGYVIRVCQ